MGLNYAYVKLNLAFLKNTFHICILLSIHGSFLCLFCFSLFDLVLSWSDNILENMQVQNRSPASLRAAKRWFQTKVTAIKGMWWPEQFGVQYEEHSYALIMSSYFLKIIDKKSCEDIMNWQKLSKEVTLKQMEFCLHR